jgi:type IV pilus assembly protein PilP
MRPLAAVLLALLALPVAAQQEPPAQPADQAAGAEPSKATEKELRDAVLKETEPQAGAYQYNPQGRRDPFISLLVNVGPAGVKKSHLPGMPGFLIQEVALKGIVKDQAGYIAMLQATDGKSYFAKIGQRFYDGVIVAMDAATVTFRQEVSDPLSPVKSRDVKKSLYASEEARQ